MGNSNGFFLNIAKFSLGLEVRVRLLSKEPYPNPNPNSNPHPNCPWKKMFNPHPYGKLNK